MIKCDPFRYLKSSPEIICLTVMMYVRFPLSLRNVEDLLHERCIEITHETDPFWWNKFGPLVAAESRLRRVDRLRSEAHWQWYLGEFSLRIIGKMHDSGELWITWARCSKIMCPSAVTVKWREIPQESHETLWPG